MSNGAIEITGLTKVYGDTVALDNVSLRLGDNKIIGLLGRNGAGKSTLLNCITNRVFPDGGVITVDGRPAQENDAAQGDIYLMSEKTYYPETMKVRDVFRWTKVFYPGFDEAYAMELTERFGLHIHKAVKSLSTGFTSIFKLIVALSVGTPYVFFDEPVLGLDANNRDLFYRLLIQRYAERPCTIVLSTHLIEEVSSVVEDVVIIKEGRIIRNEPRETLLAGGYTVSGTAAEVDRYTAGRDVIGADALGGLKTAYLIGRPEGVPAGLEVTAMDLQKLFIQLTNS